MEATVLGYPRIGARRELKKATEAFWAGRETAADLEETAAARGAGGVTPLEMTKWFDTNYHYLVPELGPGTDLRLAGDKPVREYREARSYGIETRPVLLGPLSFLLLSKPAEAGFQPLSLLDSLLDVYAELLGQLTAAGFAHDIGPGVWDIHSPRVPDVAEITEALSLAMSVIGPVRLWVNPDCGLKTRGYAETEAALRNLVEAARQARAAVAEHCS